jgi:hypothetical protein
VMMLVHNTFPQQYQKKNESLSFPCDRFVSQPYIG